MKVHEETHGFPETRRYIVTDMGGDDRTIGDVLAAKELPHVGDEVRHRVARVDFAAMGSDCGRVVVTYEKVE